MQEKYNKVQSGEWISDPLFHCAKKKGVWGLFRKLFKQPNRIEGDATELVNIDDREGPAPPLVPVFNARCILCKGIYSYKGTSNLHRHLVLAHLPFINSKPEHRELITRYLGQGWICDPKNQTIVQKK
eukprot:414636_1